MSSTVTLLTSHRAAACLWFSSVCIASEQWVLREDIMCRVTDDDQQRSHRTSCSHNIQRRKVADQHEVDTSLWCINRNQPMSAFIVLQCWRDMQNITSLHTRYVVDYSHPCTELHTRKPHTHTHTRVSTVWFTGWTTVSHSGWSAAFPTLERMGQYNYKQLSLDSISKLLTGSLCILYHQVNDHSWLQPPISECKNKQVILCSRRVWQIERVQQVIIAACI